MSQYRPKSWNSKKKKEVVKRGDTVLTDPRPDDIIIPVVGPTGVGKSTFINTILGPVSNRARVGHQLDSCTDKLQHFIIKRGDPGYRPNLRGRRLVIVDTPGFDNTYKEDSEILRRISAWLAHSYDNNAKVSGVIYLHDISQTHAFENTIHLFRELVGDINLGSVILGTTKWSLLKSEELGRKREAQLKDAYWSEFVAKGSTVSVADGTESSREMIDHIVNRDEKYVLMIQNELVELNKSLPQTEAGKLVNFQRRPEGFKILFGKQIAYLFGFEVGERF